MNFSPILDVSISFSKCMLHLHITTDGTKNEVHENLLAYVTWMCFKTLAIEKKTGLYMANNEFYE